MAQNFTPITDLIEKYNEMKYGAGSMAKEALPVAQNEQVEHEDTVEHEPAQKPVAHYVTPHADSISLPPALKELGLEEVNTTDFPKLNNIRLPISDEQIMKDLQAPPTESKRWYATFFVYLLERAHLTLKRVGTKVIRVMKIG